MTKAFYRGLAAYLRCYKYLQN